MNNTIRWLKPSPASWLMLLSLTTVWLTGCAKTVQQPTLEPTLSIPTDTPTAVSVPTDTVTPQPSLVATITQPESTKESQTVFRKAAPACQLRPSRVEQTCVSSATGLQFWLYVPAPEVIPADQKPPLLVYLHGFSHSGSDLGLLLSGGLPLQIENKRELPMIVVSPQCPSSDNWQSPEMVERLSKFVDEMVALYGADPERVFMTGFSMGGDGAWALGIAHPEQIAALVPVGSGYVNEEQVCALKDVRVWDFQGDQDELVSPEYAKKMTAALERCGGGEVKLTLLTGANHEGSSGITYGMDELYQWMLK